jgi:DNA-binding transcriptional LysR family regulator
MSSFVRVVDAGGFSAAARQIGISTSMVTTHVKALEGRLGVRLLNRNTRNVSLTEAGHGYYERCIKILREIEDAEEAAQELQSNPRGVLRLNVSPAMLPFIAPSIDEFTARNPLVSVRATETTRMVNLVEDGFDLAVRFMAHADQTLILRRLASFRLVVCASPDYLATYGHPQHPTELADHNCLIYYEGCFGRDGKEWRFTGPDGALPVHVNGRLEANSIALLRHAAVHGQGLWLAPSPVVEDELRSGALIPLLTEFLPEEYSIDALYPHREHLPAKVRSFIDLVAANFRAAKWGRAERHERETVPAFNALHGMGLSAAGAEAQQRRLA